MVEFHKTSENFRFSQKQTRALLELVNPANKTLSDVATKIGVTERTVYTWLRNPNFQGRLRKEREKLLQQGIDELKTSFSVALLTLRNLLVDKNSLIRLRAAQVLVDHNLKLLEQKKENRPRHPLDDYLEDHITGEIAGGISLHDKFLRLKEITAHNIVKMREELAKEEKEKRDSHAIDLKDF